jgi:hypothetical protein
MGDIMQLHGNGIVRNNNKVCKAKCERKRKKSIKCESKN